MGKLILFIISNAANTLPINTPIEANTVKIICKTIIGVVSLIGSGMYT